MKTWKLVVLLLLIVPTVCWAGPFGIFNLRSGCPGGRCFRPSPPSPSPPPPGNPGRPPVPAGVQLNPDESYVQGSLRTVPSRQAIAPTKVLKKLPIPTPPRPLDVTSSHVSSHSSDGNATSHKLDANSLRGALETDAFCPHCDKSVHVKSSLHTFSENGEKKRILVYYLD